MEKLLQEYRRNVGNFELIDIIDTDKIAALRNHLKVETPMSVNWQWEYGSEVAELRALYEKGKKNQWNASEDIEWDRPVSKDEWMMNPKMSIMAQACQLMGKDEATQKAAAFDEVTYTISQLLHGEQAALQLCGQLTNLCPHTDEKWYAANQVADEARHNEVLARFLSEKMGEIYPIAPMLKILLDELLKAEGYQMKALGMQTLFEGMAVGIMDMLRANTECVLFADILRRVEQDESRHAAFGVLTMRRCVRDASEKEMHAMEDFAFNILETLNANQQLAMLHTIGPKYGIDARLVTEALLKMDNFVDLNSLIYMHTVMPNLKRLGLITERTEQKWRDIGCLTDNRQDGAVKITEPILAG